MSKAIPTATQLMLNLVLSIVFLIVVTMIFADYVKSPDSIHSESLWYSTAFFVTTLTSFLYAAWMWVLLPWHIATVRRHHNRTAILVASLVGIVTFGVAWLVALIWAFTNKAQETEQ